MKFISASGFFRIMFCFLLVISIIGKSYSQKSALIKIKKADFLKYDKNLGEKVQRLIGNVILEHDSTLLFCDSAYWHELTNSFEGFGNVHIKASDTLNIFSDLLNYDGNTRIAELKNNVRMVESKATLYTDHLWYNRLHKIAYYLTGGRIVDTANELISRKGYYYTDLKQAYFRDSVVLINDNYTMTSDTLKYHTESEIAWFLGPTLITSDENLIYCEHGWYDTKNDRSQFTQNAYMITKNQKLLGDSLYYDRLLNYGEARRNVSLRDTVQDIVIYGQYAEFRKNDGYSYVTDSAVAVMIDKKDSLFMHSDTLWILFDTAQKAELMLGYHHTKFYRKDLQGKCDSLVYNFSDSTIYLFNSPVLWSGKNQLSADSVHLAISHKQMDSLALINSCFIISMDDTVHKNTYNQVKGKVMTGYFKDNDLTGIKVMGNAESLYYVREDNGDLIGINKTTSNNMNIYLSKNEVTVITPVKNVDAHMLPENEVPEEERLLKGFLWLDDKRPWKKEDIFLW
jgi:lipopolysaccharide export system protein LptA